MTPLEAVARALKHVLLMEGGVTLHKDIYDTLARAAILAIPVTDEMVEAFIAECETTWGERTREAVIADAIKAALTKVAEG